MLASLLFALPAVPASRRSPRRSSPRAATRSLRACRTASSSPSAAARRSRDFGPSIRLPAFHYLTNFDEPDAAFVMVVQNGRGTSTLFLTPVGARQAFYYGRRPDSATVVRDLGVRRTRRSRALDVVRRFARRRAGFPSTRSHDFADADFAGRRLADARPAVHQGDRRAARRQARAPRRARDRRRAPREEEPRRDGAPPEGGGDQHGRTSRRDARSPSRRKEYEIQAALEGTFLRLGGARPSYGSIVGGGVHGTQLHYMRDRGDVKPGDVVVMDAATEYEGYAADITRTLPVSGKFTTEQRAIYQLVRDAQAAAERNSKPGMSSVAAQDSSVDDPREGARRARPGRERGRAVRSALAGRLHGAPARVQAGDVLDDPRHLARHRPRRARSRAVLRERSSLQGRATRSRSSRASTSAPRCSTRSPDTPKNRAFIAKVLPTVRRYENTGVRIEDDYLITDNGTGAHQPRAARDRRDRGADEASGRRAWCRDGRVSALGGVASARCSTSRPTSPTSTARACRRSCGR